MRPSWDEYFAQLARLVATRSTCPRASVGCVIVANKRIIATGYNGAPSGDDHCDDVGCKMVDGHCLRTTHAEANALLQAGRRTFKNRYAKVYITKTPCWFCWKDLREWGIKEIYVDGRLYLEPFETQ